ncbi:MAG: hypothetical protein R2848_15145 [Thermomicrobiales bacterium]
MSSITNRARLFAVLASAMLIVTLVGAVFAFGRVDAQDDSPVGQWSVALARTDIPVDIASSMSYVGRWRLGIEADGTFEAERTDAGVVIEGTWTTDGDQITFTDESGLLSCGNAAAAPIIESDMATGTYKWVRSGKNLTFTQVDDSCPGRIILLTTFSFNTFVACSTIPLTTAELLGTPVASPIAVETVELPTVPASSPEPLNATFEREIDDLLDQLTACWASREPERWLPLLSNEFRDALITSDPNFLETLTISMSSPIVWERAGEITIVAPNQITAPVKSTVGTEQDFQTFVFVFEDGQWKWNG